ncbi:uncharacterized protein B0H64DRAFT_102828 [Chaetomium fimeti]|uniref:Uncharacterized protein n=1 Tax=Chaetomium fimeti TaxID=1854472 RepID=A0AAE0LW08_9PEZI|nr:hypothetical protein B0H64DRAFT_102828 [Chaetomium fimeti]
MAIWGRPVGHQATPPGRREEDAENTRRQYLWNTPDGDKPDFAETYTHGDELVFSWNALNNSIYDLWLTSWKPGPDPVAVCLARAVNLAHDGNLKLVTSDPPTAQLANETRYVLRFKPPTGQGEFVASDTDLSSPGFLLVEPAFHQQDAPSTTAPAPPTKSRVTPARETATTALGSEESVSEMSPAAAAGLTIGLILIVAFLVAVEVGYLMWRRKRRRGAGQDGTPGSSGRRKMMKRFGKGDRGVFVQVDKAEMVIDDSIWMSPELPGDSTWGQRLVHELQGSRLGRGNPLGRPMTINSSVVELDVGRT